MNANLTQYHEWFLMNNYDGLIQLNNDLIENGLNVCVRAKFIVDGEDVLYYQHLMFQDALRRSSSVLDLLKNRYFVGKEFIDLGSVWSITRSIYETSVASSIMGWSKEKSDIEEIRYCLWRRSGLKENKRSTEASHNDIAIFNSKLLDFESRVIAAASRLEIEEESLGKLLKDKEYKVDIREKKFIKMTWSDYEIKSVANGMLMLQCYSHPTSIAMEAFSARNIYNAEHSVTVALKLNAFLIATMACQIMALSDSFEENDFCKYCFDMARIARQT